MASSYHSYIQKKSLNEFFTNVAVITLEKRKAYIQDTLNKMNIVITELFDAILGENLDRTSLELNNAIVKDCKLRTNEIACAISHLTVIKKFYDKASDNDTIFIFEDDISLNMDYYSRVKIVMQEVPKDWDFLQFGHCWDDCLRMVTINKNAGIYKSTNPLCCHSYALTKKGAKLILDNVFPMSIPIDCFFVQMSNGTYNKSYPSIIGVPGYNNGIKFNLYTIYPRLFSQAKENDNSNFDITKSTLDNNNLCLSCTHNAILPQFNTNIYIYILLLLIFLILSFAYYCYNYKKKS